MSKDAYCFQEITFRMKKDDCVLLFTDSLIESRSQDDREFGESGIIAALQDAPRASAQEILNRIIGDFFGFVGAPGAERRPDGHPDQEEVALPIFATNSRIFFSSVPSSRHT